VKKQGWIALAAVVAVVTVAWSARSIAIDAYMADDYVVTNSITNAKKACLATNDTEACAYTSAPGYTHLKRPPGSGIGSSNLRDQPDFI
jgi:hypothetical protein